MTPDELHRLVHAWQPRWLRALPNPLYQGLAGLLCVPLWVPLRLLHVPESTALAFVLFIMASALYEWRMTGPNPADVTWRALGSLVVCAGLALV